MNIGKEKLSEYPRETELMTLQRRYYAIKIYLRYKHHNSNSITGKKLLFEWSQFTISSTDLKVRITLYSIINSTTGKKVLKLRLAFI